MSSHPELKLAWCSYEAAKFAVMHWHYSRVMPRGKNSYVGVWEGGNYVGAIIFGTGGGNATNGRRYGLDRCFEMAELVRVALRGHACYVSRAVAIAIRMLKKNNPGLRLLVSMADPRQGHVGSIYQAGNWVYVGRTVPIKLYIDADGNEHHPRNVSKSGYIKQYAGINKVLKIDDAIRVIQCPGKHKYLYPLGKEMRALIEPMRKPYPKRAASETVSRPADQPEVRGSTPTAGLCSTPD